MDKYANRDAAIALGHLEEFCKRGVAVDPIGPAQTVRSFIQQASSEIVRLRGLLENAKTLGVSACDAIIDQASSEWRTPASHDVLAERRRQVEVEDRGIFCDDQYVNGELAAAAGSYALHAHDAPEPRLNSAPAWWPWSIKWWKPTDARRNLVKAGALILAEIERLDRAAAAKPAELYTEADEARMDVVGQNGPTGEHYEVLPHGLTWEQAPVWAEALIEGTGGSAEIKLPYLVWVREIGTITDGVFAVDFLDNRKAGSIAKVKMVGDDHHWKVIATRPAPIDDGWIEWNADACGPRPENVAMIRYQNGREAPWFSGVNWAPQSDSFRHNQIVAYRPANAAVKP